MAYQAQNAEYESILDTNKKN